ncbi:hypothetical protein GGI18_000128 [Coemansia linderi]|uniref:Uncharacterized protein n=1 Tax=Coemansia linderi TaxID=2663919 RepID=A0ACC1KPQ7_9FUNG|nr:hypothetical protein GGI18_000128 [Coemansia linderi]
MDSLRGAYSVGGGYEMPDSNNSMRDTSDEAINGPVVLSCNKCRTIVGDTFAYVASLPERNYIALQSVPESVVCGKTKKMATERGEENSVYFELTCAECQAPIGRRYLTTVEDMDSIRNCFALDIDKVITYELGRCLGNKTSEMPPPEFYASTAMYEEMTKLKSNLAALAAHVQKLELAVYRNGTSISPRTSGGQPPPSRKRSQGLNPEIYHVESTKRPAFDTATVANSQASMENGIAENVDGKLETKSPFLTTPLSILHIALSILGGALSSGFLLAGGFTIFCAGPGGALVAFALATIALYMVMTSLMEIRSVIPDSVPYYMFGAHVLGQTVGAALAWNFWLMWISIIAYEVAAVGHILQFWVPHVHSAVWCLPLFLCCFAIVVINTKYYTAAEHSFTMLKLCGVVVALICGALVASGKIGGHKYGLENWHRGEAPFVGGALGIACAAVYSSFSIVGAEAAAVMAMRTCSPRVRHLVPAFVCGGLAILFLTSIFITGLVVSYDSAWFTSNSDAGDSAESSTFTYIFELARLHAGADIVNAVLLVTALFDCCAALYVSSALLQDLGMRGLAPRFLREREGNGQGRDFSVYCLATSSIVALTIWGLSYISAKYSLSIIAGAIGVSGFIMWGSVAVMHIRVRCAKRFRDVAKSIDGAYRAWLFPVGPIFCLLYVVSSLGGVIWVAVWLGFLVDMFLLATSQLLIFVILLLVAATVQYFGYCRC